MLLFFFDAVFANRGGGFVIVVAMAKGRLYRRLEVVIRVGI